MFVESLRRKRCEALLRRGYARVRERAFDSALEIAAQLESQRFSGAFEIAALAHAGKGDLDAAVAVLRRGVEVAPDVWLNWQLLGNYLSDLGRYEDAEAAYNRALACPGCSTDSVRLNLAILANRRDRPAVVLEFLDELHDPKVVAHAREVRISSLRALGKLAEALALAESALEGGPLEEEMIRAEWERIAATAARIRLALKESPAEVRAWVHDALRRSPTSAALFRVMRELDSRRSPATRRFEITVHGAIPLRSPKRQEVAGFYSTYTVAAGSSDQGLQLIRDVEALLEPGDPANLSIDDVKDLGPAADEPLGVMWRSGRSYYERDE